MELLRFSRPEDAARAAREVLSLEALRRMEETGSFSLGLSGGGTPVALYRLLAGDGLCSGSKTAPWKQVRLFQVDERMVAAKSEHSNAALIGQTLLSGPGTAQAAFHPMPTHLPAQEAATAYDALLCRELGGTAGPPALDCAVMGMGADGHTASIFPDHPLWHSHLQDNPAPVSDSNPLAPASAAQAADSDNVLFVSRAGMPPYVPRLTLSPAMLVRTGLLLYMVSARDKSSALERILQGDRTLPAARIQGAERTVWIVSEK